MGCSQAESVTIIAGKNVWTEPSSHQKDQRNTALIERMLLMWLDFMGFVEKCRTGLGHWMEFIGQTWIQLPVEVIWHNHHLILSWSVCWLKAEVCLWKHPHGHFIAQHECQKKKHIYTQNAYIFFLSIFQQSVHNSITASQPTAGSITGYFPGLILERTLLCSETVRCIISFLSQRTCSGEHLIYQVGLIVFAWFPWEETQAQLFQRVQTVDCF